MYVGIGVGAGVFLLCVVLLLFYFCKRSPAGATDPKSAPLMTSGGAKQAVHKGSSTWMGDTDGTGSMRIQGEKSDQKSTQPRISVYQQATHL